MTPAAMRLKANLRNSSARTGIPAQLLLQDFFLERFLARFCASDVRAQFVFKGGILLMGLLARRTTMDLDATLRNAPLSGETVREMVSRVCAIDAGDGVSLSVSGVAPIRKDDEYGGFRVKVAARFAADFAQRLTAFTNDNTLMGSFLTIHGGVDDADAFPVT